MKLRWKAQESGYGHYVFWDVYQLNVLDGNTCCFSDERHGVVWESSKQYETPQKAMMVCEKKFGEYLVKNTKRTSDENFKAIKRKVKWESKREIVK